MSESDKTPVSKKLMFHIHLFSVFGFTAGSSYSQLSGWVSVSVVLLFIVVMMMLFWAGVTGQLEDLILGGSDE